MIILSNTTDKIQVLLGGSSTSPLPCYASYRDTQSGATLTPGRTVVNTDGATPVDVVPGPAASTQRGVDNITITNPNSGAATVTVRYNANSSTYVLSSLSLAGGETLQYSSGEGWRVLSNAGSVKHSVNQGAAPVSSGWSMAVLSSNVVNNNVNANTIQDVTGLSFSVTSGKKYAFRAIIEYTSAATGTGSRWSINGPAAVVTYASRYSLAATTQTINSALNAYDLPAASNATSGNTAGNIAYIDGFIDAAENGTLTVRFASEVTNSAVTAIAGSFIEWIEVL
jgi:hypothetical protein